MTDSSTFRDIVEQSTEEVTEVQPQETSEAPIESATEAPQTEEVFAEKGELAGKTPEELEKIHKNWQQAYTAKRQKETQELKEYKQRLAELEQRVNTPQAAHQNIEDRAQEARHQVDLGNMPLDQYTEYVQELMAEKARLIAREEYKTIRAEEEEIQLQSRAAEDFKSADDRLNELAPEYDEQLKTEVQRELADLLDEHLVEHQSYKGFDAKQLAKQIIERRDKQLDEVIKQRTQQSTQAAKMREAKARKSGVRGTTSDSQQVGGNSFRSILSETLDSGA